MEWAVVIALGGYIRLSRLEVEAAREAIAARSLEGGLAPIINASVGTDDEPLDVDLTAIDMRLIRVMGISLDLSEAALKKIKDHGRFRVKQGEYFWELRAWWDGEPEPRSAALRGREELHHAPAQELTRFASKMAERQLASAKNR